MRTLDTLLDPLFAALAGLPAIASLAIVSLVVTVALLVTFKWTSNQAALSRVKRAIGARLLELRLFQDDPVLVGRALAGLLAAQARYLRYALVPLLWLALPLLILFVHLDAWYARAPVSAGEAAVVVMRVSTWVEPGRPALSLEAPEGVRVETPVVWAPTTREAVWRIRPAGPGAYTLLARAGHEAVTHVLHVGPRTARLDEPWSDHSSVTLLNVDYPPRPFHVAGLSLAWLPVFLILTLAFTLLLKRFFHVTL
jgi:hypothetical protein